MKKKWITGVLVMALSGAVTAGCGSEPAQPNFTKESSDKESKEESSEASVPVSSESKEETESATEEPTVSEPEDNVICSGPCP